MFFFCLLVSICGRRMSLIWAVRHMFASGRVQPAGIRQIISGWKLHVKFILGRPEPAFTLWPQLDLDSREGAGEQLTTPHKLPLLMPARGEPQPTVCKSFSLCTQTSALDHNESLGSIEKCGTMQILF